MKKNKITDNTLYFFLTALGISALSLIICAFIMSLIAYSGEDPTKKVAVFSLIALVASATVSGIIISQMKGDGGAKFTALVSLSLMLVLLLISVITEKGILPASVFMNYGCYIGISVLAAHLGKKREKKRRHR